MTEYNTHHGGSNPEQPHLMHIFTMLTNWEQIERILLPGIAKARSEPSFAKPVSREYLGEEDQTETDDDSSNVYEGKEAWNVIRDINYRLNLPIHRCTTPTSTHNTLLYLFHHMKCGIFVMIRDGKLRIFAPFVNSDYRNTWGGKLTLEGDGSLNTYYSHKAGLYRDENIEPDKSKWWANGNIICNELSKPEDKDTTQFWGDHFLAALRDMIGEACRERTMPDCEFFLNKRDYPQLKVNIPRGGEPVEPYGFIFDKDDRVAEEDVELFEEHKFESYAPIVSFYAAKPDRFADIPWPSSEDWEAACGLVFPGSFMHSKDKDGNAVFAGKPRDLFTEENFRKFERGWDDGRVATAFFRGTATGGGTTIETNQRLMVTHLGHIWKDDPEKGGEEPFVNAAIVGWNMRDKKTAKGPMTFLRPKNFGFDAGKHHFTPIYEQSKYKYLIYVDGHCAACRYGFMMRLGSVILKVAPRQVADTMWYFPLLQPYVDHVPVKADLSDLEEKIRWCRQNDDKCREIGENAKKFFEKYVSRNALLDYVEMACKQISKRFVKPPEWWAPPTAYTPTPKLRKPDMKCFEDKKSGNSRFCTRCQCEVDEEERLKEEERKKEKEDNKNKVGKKLSHRERMKRKAAEMKKKKDEASKKKKMKK
mmetsp:Transcript_31554/g.60262  ORF Transcript_31554/g.60262 Transcript_31554/m.60262 type:complete len:646 (-) Transcript_31554:206-2143(-)